MAQHSMTQPTARPAGVLQPGELTDAMVDLIAARFRLLGEPLRLKLLIALESGERSVGELVTLTGASQANVSKHLAALTQAGALHRRKAGVTVYYVIEDDTIFTLCSVVCSGLQDRIAAQARVLGINTHVTSSAEDDHSRG